jgi:glucuronyl/N-acetylglucosaminyl transferase EXT1
MLPYIIGISNTLLYYKKSDYNLQHITYLLYRYFNYLYTHHISSIYESELDGECADLGLAFLISHITREGPIKLTQRKKTIANSSNTWSVWNQRRTCFSQLIHWFGYMPLIKSQMRFDPVLYKDAVSNTRKKYRKLELMT